MKKRIQYSILSICALIIIGLGAGTMYAASSGSHPSVDVKQKSKARFYNSLSNIPNITVAQKDKILQIHQKYQKKNSDLRRSLYSSYSNMKNADPQELQRQKDAVERKTEQNQMAEIREIKSVLTPTQVAWLQTMIDRESNSSPRISNR